MSDDFLKNIIPYVDRYEAGENVKELYQQAKNEGLKGWELAEMQRMCGVDHHIATHRVMLDGLHPYFVVGRDPSSPTQGLPEFKKLFLAVVETMLRLTELQASEQLTRNNNYHLHGGGFDGDWIKPDALCDVLYLGDNKFYHRIRIVLKDFDDHSNDFDIMIASEFFVTSLAETRNDPPFTGPWGMANAVYVDEVIEGTLKEYGII